MVQTTVKAGTTLEEVSYDAQLSLAAKGYMAMALAIESGQIEKFRTIDDLHFETIGDKEARDAYVELIRSGYLLNQEFLDSLNGKN